MGIRSTDRRALGIWKVRAPGGVFWMTGLPSGRPPGPHYNRTSRISPNSLLLFAGIACHYLAVAGARLFGFLKTVSALSFEFLSTKLVAGTNVMLLIAIRVQTAYSLNVG